ncbi:MAG: (deoxy)nucleoside triphosphate pyrophosphohydrolase [Bryobacteraceae bacterium]
MRSRLKMVVAAVVERDGQMLVCQRKAGARYELKWEFPGGKVEAGETPRQALRRELEEELGIQAEIGAEIARYEYRYPARTPILLIFFRVTRYSGEPANLDFTEIRWEARERLPHYDFLDGDVDFVRRLARGEFETGPG